jgi:hypothetical protein
MEYDIRWYNIKIPISATSTLWVQITADAVKDKAGVRIGCSFKSLLDLTKSLGCLPLTAKIADQIFVQSDIKLDPTLMNVVKNTNAEHSAKIDQQLSKYTVESSTIISNVGKDWVISNKITSTKAANYGWFIKTNQPAWRGVKMLPTETLNDVKCIQCLSTRHDPYHLDYSQTVRMMARKAYIDDKEVDLLDLMRDPTLCKLVLHEGRLNDYVYSILK